MVSRGRRQSGPLVVPSSMGNRRLRHGRWCFNHSLRSVRWLRDLDDGCGSVNSEEYGGSPMDLFHRWWPYGSHRGWVTEALVCLTKTKKNTQRCSLVQKQTKFKLCYYSHSGGIFNEGIVCLIWGFSDNLRFVVKIRVRVTIWVFIDVELGFFGSRSIMAFNLKGVKIRWSTTCHISPCLSSGQHWL